MAQSTPPTEPPADGSTDSANHPVAADPAPELTADDELSTAVVALTDESLPVAERRRWLGRLVRTEIRQRGVKDLFKPKAAIRWITDAVADVAPHIPIRDLDTLRQHFPDLEGDALADRLVRNAARVTASVGAAGGGVAAIEWAVAPALLSAPVLLAAETVAVVSVEVKLIGELHEVYGQPIRGTAAQRATALVQSWAEKRGVNPIVPGVGAAAILGTAARKELRDRLIKRFGRNLTTLGPFLTGAAVAGFLNRRATKSLGEEILKQLRQYPKVIEG
jgi:hypothetical protein